MQIVSGQVFPGELQATKQQTTWPNDEETDTCSEGRDWLQTQSPIICINWSFVFIGLVLCFCACEYKTANKFWNFGTEMLIIWKSPFSPLICPTKHCITNPKADPNPTKVTIIWSRKSGTSAEGARHLGSTRGLGSIVSSPSGVRGMQSPGRHRYFAPLQIKFGLIYTYSI